MNSAAYESRPQGNRPTVLIVEGEALVRLMLAEELRSQGLDVIEASNGDEALSVLRSSGLHLLLTDVQMPRGRDGSLLAFLAHTTSPEVKIVTASGQQPGGHLREIAHAFFLKPYDL